MPSTTLILIRHAHTRSNGGDPHPRMLGWADIALSEHGLEQVQRLCGRLKTEPPFEAIYSSPLRRALQTAAPLASRLDTVQLCAGLREINCGEMDGLLIEEVQQRHRDLWLANMRQDDDDFRWPGGESYAELRRRALTNLREVALRHHGARIALVTHAGFISQVVGSLLGTRPANWQAHRPQNTSMTELHYARGSLSLASFDDHRHLDAGETCGTPIG